MVAINYNYHCSIKKKKRMLNQNICSLSSTLISFELSPSSAAIYSKVYLQNCLYKLFNLSPHIYSVCLKICIITK